MSTDVQLSDQEFEALIADEWNKKLSALLQRVAEALSRRDTMDEEVATLIRMEQDSLAVFVQKLSQIVAPNINVTTNVDQLIKAVNDSTAELKFAMDRSNELLEKLIAVRTADVELTPHRGYGGTIDRITAKIVDKQ